MNRVVISGIGVVSPVGSSLDEFRRCSKVGPASARLRSYRPRYFKLYGQNSEKAHPLSIPRWMVNAAASQVSIDLGLKGPTWTVATAFASGAHVIGQALHMVRSGQAPIAVAGGTEACLAVGTVKAWEALRALSTDTCRLFSRNRSGLVLGEGAAMFVLEPRDRALARGAPVCAHTLGRHRPLRGRSSSHENPIWHALPHLPRGDYWMPRLKRGMTTERLRLRARTAYLVTNGRYQSNL
jgi:Beta-ketoacyl synthase, N-terminal domain